MTKKRVLWRTNWKVTHSHNHNLFASNSYIKGLPVKMPNRPKEMMKTWKGPLR